MQTGVTNLYKVYVFMDEISNKTLGNFRGKVVRKDLTSMMKRGVNVPGYVLEYLLGSYCATDDQTVINEGVRKIAKILSSNYVRHDEIEKIKYLIKEKGSYTIIDKVTGSVDEVNDKYLGRFSNFDIGYFILNDNVAKQYPALFTGGIWCSVKIEHKEEAAGSDDEALFDVSPKRRRSKKAAINHSYSITGIRPIQVPNIDIDFIKEQRKNFTTEEWIFLILRSAGIEPTGLNEKERMHFLERLVPLFEKNYNLVELGPRGTGKSHVYKEVSPHSILVSGSATSISSLFYNISSRQVGLVGSWDVVAFDEISGMRFSNPVGLEILKDFMASGSFTRGNIPIYADASMVFIGNINDTVSNIIKTSHLFSPFPRDLSNDSAFFDRMHYYLPGWEVPKIKSEYLTTEFGFISDYFSEFARDMRKEDHSQDFNEWFKLNDNANVRDEIAIRKTVSGLIKIIYPDGIYTRDDIEKLLVYAIEGRRRVKEQLKKIAGDEFADVDLGYIRNDGKEVIVNVPEKADTTLITDEALEKGHVYCVGYSLAFEVPSIYKVEVKTIAGNGKIEVQGLTGFGRAQALEAINAGYKQFLENVNKIKPILGITSKDYLIFVNDLQKKYCSKEISVAEFIALCSSVFKKPVLPRLIVAGEVSLSGTILHFKGVEDYVRFAKNAGAKKILMPAEGKMEFDKIDINELGDLEPLYYTNVVEAAKIALDLN